MIRTLRLLAGLRNCERGSAVIEFAVIGPTVCALMVAVVQVGMAAQAYNALRSASADAARYAVVEYQNEREPTDAEIEIEAEDIATSAPYFLDEDRLTLDVDTALVQTIDGAIEMTITATYTPPLVLPLIDFDPPEMTYTRPIYVLDPDA